MTWCIDTRRHEAKKELEKKCLVNLHGQYSMHVSKFLNNRNPADPAFALQTAPQYYLLNAEMQGQESHKNWVLGSRFSTKKNGRQFKLSSP